MLARKQFISGWLGKSHSFSIDVTVGARSLGADEVVGVLGEGGVVDQAGPVHQVEEVAVVRPIVKQRQGLGHGVGINKASRIAALNEGEGEVVNVAVDRGRVRPCCDKTLGASVVVETLLPVGFVVVRLSLAILIVPKVHLINDLLLSRGTRL